MQRSRAACNHCCTLAHRSLINIAQQVFRNQSGVAPADFPSQFVPIFCILLRHFNHCHVLSHRIHIMLGLPCFLFPDSSIISILLPIYPFIIYPSYMYVQTTTVSPVKNVTPKRNRNIFNSATSISASDGQDCLFVSATVSYNISKTVCK